MHAPFGLIVTWRKPMLSIQIDHRLEYLALDMEGSGVDYGLPGEVERMKQVLLDLFRMKQRSDKSAIKVREV